MRIDDFVMLGRTVPEDSKKYGIRVCGAGYSHEMRSFIRIYPLPVKSSICARDMMSIEVERNNRDSRLESWTLKTRDEKSIVGNFGKKSKEDIRCFLESRVSTIEDLNKDRKSLGVIKPDDFEIVIKTRKSVHDPSQLSLFDDFVEEVNFKLADDYFKIPYLSISTGIQKHLQLREWGVYELIRKNQSKISSDYIKMALRITGESETYFIIGNMNQFRNTWLVIKAFSFDKRMKQKSLL